MVRNLSFALWLSLTILSSSLWGQSKPGSIIVSRVSGEVIATELATGEAIPLVKGKRISQGYSISSGEDGSAILLFSNGATLTIKPKTEISIEEYLQDPFAGEAEMASLDSEPSVSRTKLNLKTGELVGSVKKLNYDQGSLFEVTSAIGTAGIRGTDWSFSIVGGVTQDASGMFGIAIGSGYFIPIGATTPIAVGSKVVINIRGTISDTGVVVIEEVSPPQEMTADMEASVTNEAEAAKELFAEFKVEEFIFEESTETEEKSEEQESTEEGEEEESEGVEEGEGTENESTENEGAENGGESGDEGVNGETNTEKKEVPTPPEPQKVDPEVTPTTGS